MSAFEPGDQRKTVWTNSNTVSGVTYPYPYKYKVRLGIAGAPKSEYEIILRLAELYLIRAEARTQQNVIPGAQSDLNAIRTRAGLPNTMPIQARLFF
jgi:SusD family.